MEALFPFSGFYESEHDAILNHALESLCQDENGDPRSALADIWEHVNYGPVRAGYARLYIKRVLERLEEETALKLKVKLQEIDSPREYNFSTDKLVVEITQKSVRAAYKHLQDAGGIDFLEKLVRKKFTSFSGFYSFYKNSLVDVNATDEGGSRSWQKPVVQWDAVQIGVLLEALFLYTIDEDDLRVWNLLEGDDCDVENLVYANLDAEGKKMLKEANHAD